MSAVQVVSKREQILAVAQELFMHYGIAKTTMRQIAERMDMAVSNLYQYFANKDEIILAIAQDCRNKQEVCVRQLLDNPELSCIEKLETLFVEKFRNLTRFRETTPHGKELMEYLVRVFPDHLSSCRQNFQNDVALILEEGVRQSALKEINPQETARILQIATSSFYLPAFVELPIKPTEADLLFLLRWVMSQVKN